LILRARGVRVPTLGELVSGVINEIER
jgi:hypothetical protein